jgi:tRNA pseudouridine13 synthase
VNWHPWTDLPLPPLRTELAYPGDPESFRVEEIPLYEPCGEGEHLYILVEKRGIDTPALVELIAQRLGIPAGALGWAGRKDRHSTARQWLSLPRVTAEPRLKELADPRFEILAARPHRNKLRMGHLLGNRFRLRLAGKADEAVLAAAFAQIEAGGLPNYFGAQRFGREGDNHLRGAEQLAAEAAGGRRGRGRRVKFMQSAFQSALFNRVCAARQATGSLLAGDLAWIHAKGAVFRVEDPEQEAARYEAMEISPSGPLPGGKMMEPDREAGELELELLVAGGWRPEFASILRGGRRPLRVPLTGATLTTEEGGFELCCVLPPGSYASVLLALLGVRAMGESDPDQSSPRN